MQRTQRVLGKIRTASASSTFLWSLFPKPGFQNQVQSLGKHEIFGQSNSIPDRGLGIADDQLWRRITGLLCKTEPVEATFMIGQHSYLILQRFIARILQQDMQIQDQTTNQE